MQGGRKMLAGRYRLEEIAGRGGMSTVYRALDTVLDRTVAVKVLSPALAGEGQVHVARFEREAKAAAALSDSGIAAVYDSGADDGMPFIVMEFVPGRSVAELLGDGRPLEIAQALRIAQRVAETLAAAHAAGIVHRDIKPGNVMVAGDTVKVLDFGIARAVDGTVLTQTSSVLGTAGYMAPEQVEGKHADERSDIYALGCLLYAMLTGHPPFTGEVAAAILHQHLNAEPRPPRELRAEVPPVLDALVLQMLAKDPVVRPRSAAEVRDRLGRIASREVTQATRRLPRKPAVVPAPTHRVGAAGAAAGGAAVADEAAADREAARADSETRRWRALALALAALILIGGLVVLAATSGSSTPPSRTRVIPTTPSPTHTATESPRTPTTTTPTSPPPATSTPTAPTTTPTSPTSPQPTPPGHGGTPPGHPGKSGGPPGH